MFLSRNKKNNVYPCEPQFYNIKVGFKGSKLYRYVFVMKFVKIIIFSRPKNWDILKIAKIFNNFLYHVLGQ